MKPSFLAIFFALPLFGGTLDESTLSLEQKLKLKLIEEHWKDKDFAMAKAQIEEYLTHFSEHSASSHLHLMVGDLYFEEKDFANALSHYQKIQEKSLQDKVFEQKLYCFFMLKDFKKLKEEAKTSSVLSFASKRILAEGLFQEAKNSQDIDYRTQLLQAAKGYYLELMGSSLEESALAPLADIYRYEKNYAAAADTFNKLSSLHTGEKKEYFQFQAAQMYSFYDLAKALLLFDKLRFGNGEYAFQATLKEIQLLAEKKEHLKIIQVIDEELATGTSKTATATLLYYKGKAFLCEGMLDEAITSLQASLDETILSQEIKKKAYLSLLFCAKQKKNISLADRAIAELKSAFPNDPDLVSALLVHLSLNSELKRDEMAKEDLILLIDLDENPKNIARYQLDLGIVEERLGNHALACSLFSRFFEEDKLLQKEAAKHFIKSASSLIEEFEGNKGKKPSFEPLLKTLSFLQAREDLLEPEDKEKGAFLLAKTLFECNEKEKALEHIDKLLFSAKSPKVKHLSHLLAAKGAEDLHKSTDIVFYHLNEALLLEEDLAAKASLHIKIFNTLLFSNEERAADHLFSAFTIEPKRLQNNNLLWLAHFYFKQAKSKAAFLPMQKSQEALLAAQRSLRLFLYAFDTLCNFMGDHLHTCARLLFDLQRFSESKKLIETALKQPLFSSSQKAELRLFLARIEALQGEKESCLQEIESILKAFPPTTTKMGQKAYLEKHKLFKEELLKRENLTDSDKDFLSLISAYKMLEITRLDVFEPIGIEASLDITELKLHVTPEGKKEAEALKLYRALKEKYETIQSILVQKETSQALKTAELIGFYLIFIENEIKRFTGSLKAATYEGEKKALDLPSLLKRWDTDADYIRQRLSCAS